MKYFREIKPDERAQEGDLAFFDDDPVMKSHRVRIEQYRLTEKGASVAKEMSTNKKETPCHQYH